jgi:hypothetical protein
MPSGFMDSLVYCAPISEDCATRVDRPGTLTNS